MTESQAGKLADLSERVRYLEGWKAAHDGKINEKWKRRDAQDEGDQRRFRQLEERLMDAESNLKLLAQKVAWLSALGGAVAGVAFQVVVRIFGWAT